MKITVYTVSDCQYSQEEKEYLKSHNLPFEEKNLEMNREWLTEMLAVSNNFAGTPVTKIEKDDGQILVLKGFDPAEFDQVFGFNQSQPSTQPPSPQSKEETQQVSTSSPSSFPTQTSPPTIPEPKIPPIPYPPPSVEPSKLQTSPPTPQPPNLSSQDVQNNANQTDNFVDNLQIPPFPPLNDYQDNLEQTITAQPSNNQNMPSTPPSPMMPNFPNPQSQAPFQPRPQTPSQVTSNLNQPTTTNTQAPKQNVPNELNDILTTLQQKAQE